VGARSTEHGESMNCSDPVEIGVIRSIDKGLGSSSGDCLAEDAFAFWGLGR
jgi:hypothetical protein